MSAKSKAELKAYYSWFLAAIPERIADLTHDVRATAKYSQWKPDYSRTSLVAVGHWFAEKVEKRDRTASEIATTKRAAPYPIDVESWELSASTFATAVSVAMYFAEVLRRRLPHLEWKQQRGGKRNVYYGHAVFLNGRGNVCNPVHLVIVLAYGIVRGRRSGDSLPELYDIWEKELGG